MKVIAIDSGGTFLRGAVFDPHHGLQFLHCREASSFINHPGMDASALQSLYLDTLVDLICATASAASVPRPWHVAVAFPGPVDSHGQVLRAPTLWGDLTGSFPLQDMLRDRLHPSSSLVMNDITAASWFYATRVNVKRFSVVTVSSGIGNKVFDRDYPQGVLLSDNGYGGELGHVTVDTSPDAELCDCGGRGHLGAISSGRGVERLARRLLSTTDATFMTAEPWARLRDKPSTLMNETHLVPAIRRSDPFALHVLATATTPLVKCLQTLSLAIGIEKYVIIGGFALSIGDIYLKTLHRLWDNMAGPSSWMPRSEDIILLGSKEDYPCLVGGAERLLMIHNSTCNTTEGLHANPC